MDINTKYYATQLGRRFTDTDELYKEWTGKSPNYDRMLTNTFYSIVRNREDGSIVGVAHLIIMDDPVWDRRWGLIENVYVAKAHQRQGIGDMLMEILELQAALFGCKFIKLTSSKEEGKALYRSRNYKEGSSFRKDL